MANPESFSYRRQYGSVSAYKLYGLYKDSDVTAAGFFMLIRLGYRYTAIKLGGLSSVLPSIPPFSRLASRIIRVGNMSTQVEKSYTPLSVEHYTSKTALDPYWASRNWTPSVTEQYIHSHRYIGECVLHALQQISLIPASSDFLGCGGQAFSPPKGEIKVLDACCGPGVLESLLFENKGDIDVNVLSVDRDEVMLEETRRKADLGKWSGIHIQNMDVAVSPLSCDSTGKM